MAHFYGTAQGNRGVATRCGTKNSGVHTVAAGHDGSIQVYVDHDHAAGVDRYMVTIEAWQGSGGQTKILAEGLLDAGREVEDAQ